LLLKELREKLGGAFVYDDHELESKLGQREWRGPLKLVDGTILEGEFLVGTNVAEGRFMQVGLNGKRIFEGYMVDNKANGKGRLIEDSGVIYVGDWNDNKKEGFGTLIGTDKYTYKGQFFNDLAHGKGSMTLVDGTTYDGEFN
jgi:hypothetical protein